MREYETMFIIQPEISEEGTAAILAKLDGALEKSGSTRLLCEDMGKRKLAYEIDKFHKGHYHLLRYLDGGQVVPVLERQMRLDESVLRFMTIVVNDEVIDVESRVVHAKEEEAEQAKRAAERAARDAEELRARAEAERLRAEADAEAEAAATIAAAESAAEAEGEALEGDDAEGDTAFDEEAETLEDAAADEEEES